MRRRLSIVLFCSLSVVACSSEDSLTEPTTITVNATPAGATVEQGSSTTFTATASISEGFSGAVSISVAGVPEGVTVTVGDVAVNGLTAMAEVTIMVGAAVAAGSYDATVTASGSGVSATATFGLVVTAVPSFELTVAPDPVSITLGTSGDVVVTVARESFTGEVTLTAEDLPVGVTSAFSPDATTGGTSTLTLTVAMSAAPGSTTITVRGTSDDLNDRTATLALTVTPDMASGVGLDWMCDWTNGTGDGLNAILGIDSNSASSSAACFEGRTAFRQIEPSVLLSVETATNANSQCTGTVPTTNVLAIKQGDNSVITPAGSEMLTATDDWATIAVGEYLFKRWYDCLVMETDENNHTHYKHGGRANDYAGGNYAYNVATPGSDSTMSNHQYQVGLQVSDSDETGRGSGFFNMNNKLKMGRWYLRETRIHRTDTDSLQHRIRITDVELGTIVFTGADFLCSTDNGAGCVGAGGFGVDSVGAYKSSFNIAANDQSLTSIEFGNNGQNEAANNFDPTTLGYIFAAGWGVRISVNANDWIGSYPVVGSGER